MVELILRFKRSCPIFNRGLTKYLAFLPLRGYPEFAWERVYSSTPLQIPIEREVYSSQYSLTLQVIQSEFFFHSSEWVHSAFILVNELLWLTFHRRKAYCVFACLRDKEYCKNAERRRRSVLTHWKTIIKDLYLFVINHYLEHLMTEISYTLY